MAVAVQRDLDLQFLSSPKRETGSVGAADTAIGVVDLFAGCGGLTVGALEGARRAGRVGHLELAVDAWPLALEVLASSLQAEDRTLSLDLGVLLDEGADQGFAAIHEALGRRRPTLVVAGPPCQGHSTLNNHSRHDDARNDLYLAVSRVALDLLPRAVVIENVKGVARDRRSAVRRCVSALSEHYEIAERTLDLHELGAPQARARHVLVASRDRAFDFDELPRFGNPAGDKPARDVRWAIGDLDCRPGATIFDTASVPSETNSERMKWLVAQDSVFDLPNHQRPACHQTAHKYKSMYGQLRWDRPAQTITSGFGSMGQGRFVHPGAARTLTPHEAARLQFLPDYMDFSSVEHRAGLATMIGNAAPPVLAIALVEALVAQDLI